MKNGPYILVISPSEYPGKKYRGRYMYEHHLIWWRKTGIVLPIGYNIHHKNENPHDNRFENLEMISRNTHASIHRPKTNKFIALVCEWCKEPFQRAKENVLTKKKQRQTRFYCCRSHQVKYQWQILKHKSSQVA
jgi:hypothetical protein